jgi:iron complex outermembrane receptor protein
VNNNISYQLCNLAPFFGSSGETCALNTGTAFYRGIEGEGTYAFDGVLEGLSIFLNGTVGSAKSNNLFLKQAPLWTSAQGIFYKSGGWKVSLIDKIVGQQYSDNADTQFYKLPAYNNVDFKTSYTFGTMEFGFNVSNLLNSAYLGAVSIGDSSITAGNSTVAGAPAAANVFDVVNRPNSKDQYNFMPERGYQVTVKVRL